MGAEVDEPLEYDPDEVAAVRLPEIEPHLRPQIRVLVCYPGDFEEVDGGDPKIEPIHYQYRQANKQIKQTVKLPRLTLFDLRFQVNKITPQDWPRYLYHDPGPVPVDDSKESMEDRLRMLVSDTDVKDMLEWKPDELPEVIAVMHQPRGPARSQTPPRNRRPYLQDNQVRKLENEARRTQPEVPSQPRPEVPVKRRKRVRFEVQVEIQKPGQRNRSSLSTLLPPSPCLAPPAPPAPPVPPPPPPTVLQKAKRRVSLSERKNKRSLPGESGGRKLCSQNPVTAVSFPRGFIIELTMAQTTENVKLTKGT